jgi:cytochrome b561
MAYADEYGTVQKLLHWLVALLVVGQVGLGVWMQSLDSHDPTLPGLFPIHDGIGVTILALVLVRLALRLILGVPALPRGTPRWADTLSHLNHRLLYLVLILQPVVGYLAKSAHGHGLSVFGYYSVPPAFPANPVWADWLAQAHETGAEVLIVLVLLHVLGAFYHGVIRRDGVVRRMA